MKLQPIYTTSAIFWDGSIQLIGNIELWESQVTFSFEDFKHSHLNLAIPFSAIQKVKIFRIFNIAKNGLKVISKDGRVDMFIIEDCQAFYQRLIKKCQ